MKAKLLIPALFGTMITGLVLMSTSGCSKGGFNSKPELSFKKSNSDVFFSGSLVEIILQVRDKEGDLEGTLYVEKVSKTGCLTYFTPVEYKMPGAAGTRNLDAEIIVNFEYGPGPGIYPPVVTQCPSPRDDSTFFRFWIKDEAENISDTVETPVLVFLKP